MTARPRSARARGFARLATWLGSGSSPAWRINFAFDEYSFPSGHALNAFALATTVGLGVPAAAPALALLAVSIAASHVVLGFHFLLDVIAGSLLGALIGTACALAFLT